MGHARRAAVPAAIVATSYLAGSVPFSQLAARWFAGEDLRGVGNGTVSGTALYEVAGFGPLALAGILDVAKGAVGPAIARSVLHRVSPLRAASRHEHLCAIAAGAAIAGHDWSPWLRWAGGRGLSPALGSTLVLAPEATAVLVAGMAAGRFARQSGAATALAMLSLPLVLGARRGAGGVVLGVCIGAPMLAKRVLGNSPLRPAVGSTLQDPRARRSVGERALSRLIFDRDPAPLDAWGAPADGRG